MPTTQIQFTKNEILAWNLPRNFKEEVGEIAREIAKRILVREGITATGIQRSVSKRPLMLTINIVDPSADPTAFFKGLVPVAADDPRRVADPTFVEEPGFISEYVAYRLEEKAESDARKAEANAIEQMIGLMPKWDDAATANTQIDTIFSGESVPERRWRKAVWGLGRKAGAW